MPAFELCPACNTPKLPTIPPESRATGRACQGCGATFGRVIERPTEPDKPAPAAPAQAKP